MNNRSLDFLDAVAAQVRVSGQLPEGEGANEFADRPRSGELISAIENGTALVGALPPQPPTLRGRIGGFLVGIIQRSLFWYTPSIVSFQRAVAAAFREHGQVTRVASESLSRRLSAVEEENRSMREVVQTATHALRNSGATITDLEVELKRQRTALANDVGALHTRIGALEDRVRELSDALKRTLLESAETIAATTALSADVAQLGSDTRTSEQKVNKLEKFTLSTRAEMLLMQHRLSESLRNGQPTATGHVDRTSGDAPTRLLSDVMYWDFESLFRGSEEEIKGRVEIYIPRMRDLGVGSPDMPIVDIGCGRGEWLDALKESGLLGYGVDANSMAIARCREKDLVVEQQDGLEHLKNLPSSSMGAVTAFHFIEHLPMDVLFRFLDEVLRVLKPGGVTLMETPNPDNLLVGASAFYLDPTHQRPIPGGLLHFLLQSRGFHSIESLPLHPYPASERLDDVDSPAARVLNERLFGCRDYGVLAVRP